jgi:hypothetical protein
MRIITADQRLASQTIKGQIYGRAGIGKTSLIWTLPPENTLVLDLEAGLLAIQGWTGDSISVRTWEDARDLACWIGGPNPGTTANAPYSQQHYDYCCSKMGDAAALDKYATIFVDSTTVAGRLCLQWAQQQPEAISDRTGKLDMRGAYGLLGREMVGWATHLHHTRDKNVWLVGGLEEKADDFGRKTWVPLIDGSKAVAELPYLVDEVISMVEMKTEDGTPYRAFVCHTINPWGFPAKDRSGRLGQIEEPHLGKLMAKIKGPVCPAPERLTYELENDQ